MTDKILKNYNWKLFLSSRFELLWKVSKPKNTSQLSTYHCCNDFWHSSDPGLGVNDNDRIHSKQGQQDSREIAQWDAQFYIEVLDKV